MKKTIIIGCSGAGKSTFARKLRDATGLPLYYLDCVWHRPDKSHITREEFDARLKELLKNDEWIIDGNYSRTIEMRLRECDTVFFFDLPTEVCIEGARARVGTVHEDLPWFEEEFDPEFGQYILGWCGKQRGAICKLLEKYSEKDIIVFHSRAEADEYILNYDREGKK